MCEGENLKASPQTSNIKKKGAPHDGANHHVPAPTNSITFYRFCTSFPFAALASSEKAQLFVFVEAGQAFGMVFFKKGRLDFLIRYQDFPLLVGHFDEAAAVDDREILADETALLMGRQGENLEAQLLGDEEDRTEFSKGCPKAPYTVPRNRSSAYFYGVCCMLHSHPRWPSCHRLRAPLQQAGNGGNPRKQKRPA